MQSEWRGRDLDTALSPSGVSPRLGLGETVYTRPAIVEVASKPRLAVSWTGEGSGVGEGAGAAAAALGVGVEEPTLTPRGGAAGRAGRGVETVVGGGAVAGVCCCQSWKCPLMPWAAR